MEESADLKDPTTWVVYKEVGGELTKNEDPNKFKKNFNSIVIDLITFGASDWNRNFTLMQARIMVLVGIELKVNNNMTRK